MIEAAQLRKGTVIELDGELYRVFEFQHQKIGRGGANVKTRLRNLDQGTLVDRTFGSDERLQDIRLESRRMRYLYSDDNFYYFMDLETFEQPAIPAASVEDVKQFLVENMELNVAMYEGRAVQIELPTSVDLEVVETPPPHKGDTSSGGTKPATVEGGLVVQVPFFIERGDTLRIDTRTSEYLERVRN